MVESTDTTLVGFVGDYRGLDATVTTYRPVVAIGDRLLVAQSLDWTFADLFALQEEDRKFINTLRPRPIMEGDVVWMAGQVFANRCCEVDAYGNRMKLWERFEGRYCYQVGPRRKFEEFSEGLYSHAVQLLHQAVFDRISPKLGRAKTLFEVLNNVHTVSRRDQQVQRGLYFWETREFIRYEMIRVNAQLDDDFASDEEFDAAVQGLRTRLATARLREEPRGRTHPPLRVHNDEKTVQVRRLLKATDSGGDMSVRERAQRGTFIARSDIT